MVLGVDPDVRGAVASLRWGSHEDAPSGTAAPLRAAVFDTPTVEVTVGSGAKARSRRRHDPLAMSALLASLDAPPGTLALLERPHARAGVGTSSAFQSGTGFGLWLGLLTAHGLTVRLVLPRVWKETYGLVGKEVDKSDSRAMAVAMFPFLGASLARKMDHGRAEAVLIAAFGASVGDGATEECPLSCEVSGLRDAARVALAGPLGDAAILRAAEDAAADARAAARALVPPPQKRSAQELLLARQLREAERAARLSVEQLKAQLRDKGLPVSGNKADLLARLATADAPAPKAPRKAKLAMEGGLLAEAQ